MIGRDHLISGGGHGDLTDQQTTASADKPSSSVDPSAPDLHNAWLNQVTADPALTVIAQVIAVVLVRFADRTNISQMSAASLAVPTNLPINQIDEALKLLVDRGHLRSLSRRGKARAFQFVQRARPIVRRTRAQPPVQVFPFPAAARRDVVREVVTEMLVRPHQAAEVWLKAELQRQRRSLARKGFAPETIGREIEVLEAAIRRALWRAVLMSDEGAQ
jgi:hypothetical protein